MSTDQTPLKDAEEAWIAKYRSALKDIPVQQSRSTRFNEALHRAHSIIVSRVAGILAGPLDPSHRKTSKRSLKSPVQSSKLATVSQPQTTLSGNLAESNAKVA